jgi:hypothetical protein
MLSFKDAYRQGCYASKQHMASHPQVVLQTLFVNEFQLGALTSDGWHKL